MALYSVKRSCMIALKLGVYPLAIITNERKITMLIDIWFNLSKLSFRVWMSSYAWFYF